MATKIGIEKYLLGAIAGILLIVGCSGSSGINNAGAAGFSGVSAQLFCSGFPETMAGNVSTNNITCTSNSSASKLTFNNFYEITQLGWILVEVSASGGGSAYIFQK